MSEQDVSWVQAKIKEDTRAWNEAERRLFDRPQRRIEPQKPTRATQFVGFAKSVMSELMKTRALDMIDADKFWSEAEYQEIQTILAQRAYDFAEHVIDHTLEFTTVDIVHDMPELPEMNNE